MYAPYSRPVFALTSMRTFYCGYFFVGVLVGVFFYFPISVPRKYLGRIRAVAMALCFFRRALFLLFKLSKARSLRQRRLYTSVTIHRRPLVQTAKARTDCLQRPHCFHLNIFPQSKSDRPGPSRVPSPHRLAAQPTFFYFWKGLKTARGKRSVRRRGTTWAPIICPDGQ